MEKNERNNKTLGEELVESLNEAVAWAKGEIVIPVRQYHPPATIPIIEVRKSLGLTQNQFARCFGLKVSTIRDWEQDRRTPEGPARILLAIIAKHPQLVQEVLAESKK